MSMCCKIEAHTSLSHARVFTRSKQVTLCASGLRIGSKLYTLQRCRSHSDAAISTLAKPGVLHGGESVMTTEGSTAKELEPKWLRTKQ